jgi:hypothetical protein
MVSKNVALSRKRAGALTLDEKKALASAGGYHDTTASNPHRMAPKSYNYSAVTFPYPPAPWQRWRGPEQAKQQFWTPARYKDSRTHTGTWGGKKYQREFDKLKPTECAMIEAAAIHIAQSMGFDTSVDAACEGVSYVDSEDGGGNDHDIGDSLRRIAYPNSSPTNEGIDKWGALKGGASLPYVESNHAAHIALSDELRGPLLPILTLWALQDETQWPEVNSFLERALPHSAPRAGEFAMLRMLGRAVPSNEQFAQIGGSSKATFEAQVRECEQLLAGWLLCAAQRYHRANGWGDPNAKTSDPPKRCKPKPLKFWRKPLKEPGPAPVIDVDRANYAPAPTLRKPGEELLKPQPLCGQAAPKSNDKETLFGKFRGGKDAADSEEYKPEK